MQAFAVDQVAKLAPSALDPELPRLAASAALEVDLAICEPTAITNFVALRRLFDRLPKSLLDVSSQHGPQNLNDPLSDDLFRRALAQSLSEKATTQTFANLRQAIEALMEKPIETEAHQQRKLLTGLRDFCLALSNYAAASRNVRHAPGQRSSPYRI